MSQPFLNPLEIKDLLNKYRSDLRKLEYQIQQTNEIISQLEAQAYEAEKALMKDEAPALPKPKAKAAAKPKRRGRPRKAAPTKPKAEAGAGAAPSREQATAPAAEAEKKAPAKPTRKRKSTSKKAGSKTAASKTKKKVGRPATKAKAKTSSKKADEPKGSGYRLSEWDKFIVESLKTKQQALITSDFVDIAKDNPDIKSGETQIKVKLNRSLHKLANKKSLLVKVEHSGRGYAYALQDWVNDKGELPKKFAR